MPSTTSADPTRRASKASPVPARLTLPVRNVQGEVVGQIDLDPALWSGAVKTRLLSQAIAMYRENQRLGTASTKTRGEVSGGGKKPWKQKHTGRARAGSIRSPLWRGGGIVFGPRPHKPRHRLPQAIRQQALLESLKGKLRDQELAVVDALTVDAPKTKTFAGLAKTFGVLRRSLLVLDEAPDPLVRSLRNLATFELHRAQALNAWDVLNADKVVMTKGAFELLQRRMGPAGNGTT